MSQRYDQGRAAGGPNGTHMLAASPGHRGAQMDFPDTDPRLLTQALSPPSFSTSTPGPAQSVTPGSNTSASAWDKLLNASPGMLQAGALAGMHGTSAMAGTQSAEQRKAMTWDSPRSPMVSEDLKLMRMSPMLVSLRSTPSAA